MTKFNLNTSAGHLLRRAQQYSFDKFASEIGTDGLTPRQFAVLHAVSQNEGLSQTDLVKATGIDRSTLADMISRMIKKGLLARKRTKTDARANAVSVTAAGKKAMNAAETKVVASDNAVLSVLPKTKQGEFIKMLQAISEQIDKEAEAAKPAPAPKRAAAKKKTVAKKKAPAKRKTAAKKKAPAKRKTAARKK